jgi:hypothetical protein
MATAIMDILFSFKNRNQTAEKDYSCFIKIITLFIISMPFIDNLRLLIVFSKIKPF